VRWVLFQRRQRQQRRASERASERATMAGWQVGQEFVSAGAVAAAALPGLTRRRFTLCVNDAVNCNCRMLCRCSSCCTFDSFIIQIGQTQVMWQTRLPSPPTVVLVAGFQTDPIEEEEQKIPHEQQGPLRGRRDTLPM